MPESGPVASIFENATCHGWLDRRVKLNVWERAYYALKVSELCEGILLTPVVGSKLHILTFYS